MDLTLKYRPTTFDDVVGQSFIKSILKKQIETKTFKNVYLFCGAFGCGKTTCARIFANELNHHMGSPIEIDGASNNGVDNMRALISDAQQASIDSEYKVYIIDECHMITSAAWNAGLKLIEEPPSHCVFIFCTTNPEKLPQTILSRVQRFDFKRVPCEDITDRLKYIIECENKETNDKITYDMDALNRIAVLSDGHLRDAVKHLSRCLDVSHNISTESVESLFGLVESESINKIVINMCDKNIDECIREIMHIKSMASDFVKVYDNILSLVIDSNIIFKSNNKNILNVSNSVKEKLNDNIVNILNKMIDNRKYISIDNAEAYLKTICLDVCG